MEFILLCDESAEKGKKYGDFFGGCIVNGKDITAINETLNTTKSNLHFFGELKWSKVTMPYLEKYKTMMDLFFSFIHEGKIKVRVMFRSMKDEPPHHYSQDEKYFKLYYQFIKHAFGLRTIPQEIAPVYLRIYLDQLPDTKAKCAEFKKFLLAMPHTSDFQNSPLCIREDDIAEICSHHHVLLQCVDVVLGAMNFRLNELHLAIPEGQTRRGQRTIAKERLYKHIYQLICQMKPRFNIGVSTGDCGYQNPHWECPYQHWDFKSKKINAPYPLHSTLRRNVGLRKTQDV